MNLFKLTPVAAFVFALGTAAQAQTQSTPALPGITVTSSPIIESNTVDAFAGYSTQVTEAQIKDLGALDLAAALRMTPGVQISRYNEVGSYSGDQGGNVYIRGLGASRPGSEIKTYLDGIPLYMGLWNHPLMDLLPLNAMASVDVIKGPQNPLSGNNFGAVQLQSKRASQDGTQGEVQASVGSDATRLLQAHVLGRSGAMDYSLATSQIRSDGARPNADGQLQSLMGRINRQIDAAWSVGASFLAVDNEVGDPGDDRYAPYTGTPIPSSMQSNGIARNDTGTQALSAFVTHQHGNWKGEFKLYRNQGHNNLSNDPSWGTFDSRFKTWGLRWKEEFIPWKSGKLLLGLDHENVSGSISGPNVGAAVGTPFAFGVAGSADIPSFRLTSVYTGLSHQLPLSSGWVMQPSGGVRFYDSNRYGSKPAPHAGVSFISEAVTVYANLTHGLLYPGAETYALTRAIPMAFAANNGWDQLSPTLDRHSEIGVKWDSSAQTHWDVSLFRDAISQRYIWSGFYAGAIANPASGTWSNSFPDYQINGLEAAVRHQISSQWAWFGGLTVLDASLSNLPYAPKTALSTGVTGVVAGHRIAFDAQHQTRMYSLTQDRGTFAPNEVGAFTVANARVSRPVAALGRHGEVYLALNNLLDTRYQYNAGYPMPGRNWRIGLIASF